MSTAAQLDFISEQEYLAGEQISELKYEYIDGYVYAKIGRASCRERVSSPV